jgi:hypothetical protein
MYLQSIKSVKHNSAKSVNRSILKKSRHIGCGVFIVHSSMAATINKILFCSPGRGKGYIRVSVRFPQGCGGGGWGGGEPTGIPMREKPRKHIAIILGKFYKYGRRNASGDLTKKEK